MAFTVKYVPLSPGGYSYAPQGKFSEAEYFVPLSQDLLNASLSKELEDLIRQIPVHYLDPVIPTNSTSTLAAQNPANFSEAIADVDSADYFSFLLSDQFNQADFISTPSTMLDEPMEFDFTNTSLDGGDSTEFSSWNPTPENASLRVEDWMMSATFSPEAISELQNLLSSVDQYVVPSEPDLQKSIEELDQELCSDVTSTPPPPSTTDESSEQ